MTRPDHDGKQAGGERKCTCGAAGLTPHRDWCGGEPRTIEERVRTAFAAADTTGTPQEVLDDDGKRVMLIVRSKDKRPMPGDAESEAFAKGFAAGIDALAKECEKQHQSWRDFPNMTATKAKEYADDLSTGVLRCIAAIRPLPPPKDESEE